MNDNGQQKKVRIRVTLFYTTEGLIIIAITTFFHNECMFRINIVVNKQDV